MTNETFTDELPREAEWALMATQKAALALVECDGVKNMLGVALRSPYDPSRLDTARELALSLLDMIDAAQGYSHLLAEARQTRRDR